MASESGLWTTFSKKAKRIPQVELQRHEDKFTKGIPDVSYSCLKVNGWIELKEIHQWPVRPQTCLRIDHYTAEQKGWLWRHGETGGYCWLLLQVDRDYLLFNHKQAQKVGQMTKNQCFDNCTEHWHGDLKMLKLLEILTRSYDV